LEGGSQSIDYSQIVPFNSSSFYHQPCQITQPNNQTNIEDCSVGDNVLPLPDLNTEDPKVVMMLNAWVKNLVNEYDVDGLRVDTVKHIRKDFWPDFVQAAGVFTLGEVKSSRWHQYLCLLTLPHRFSATARITPHHTRVSAQYMRGLALTLYTEVIDALLDYPAYFKLSDAFANPGGNITALIETAQATQKKYANGMFMVGSFLENHDQPRLQSRTKDMAVCVFYRRREQTI
jgi:alpha-amylase